MFLLSGAIYEKGIWSTNIKHARAGASARCLFAPPLKTLTLIGVRKMHAAHKCFSISEVADQIFSQCLKPEDNRPLRPSNLLALATVCREWLEPALDVLWETQYSLWPLLKLLPEDCWGVEGEMRLNSHMNFYFHRLPTREELTTGRVLYYSRRIKTYIDPGEPKTVEDVSDLEEFEESLDIFDSLWLAMGNAFEGIGPPLLPNLRCLFLSGASALCQIRLFLCPSVETFHMRHVYLYHSGTWPHSHGFPNELKQAFSRGTSIRSLDLDTAMINAPCTLPTLLRHRPMPMLSVKMRETTHFSLLLLLPTWLDAIEDLALSLPEGIHWPFFSFLQSNPDHYPVSSVRKLTIYARKTLQAPCGFLQAFNHPLLSSLSITCSIFDDASQPELQSLMNTLTSPRYCNQLRSLSIVENEELVYDFNCMEIPQAEYSPLLNPIDDWYEAYGYELHGVRGPQFQKDSWAVTPIPSSIFAKLAKLSGLRSLTLSLPGLSSITNDVISQMAQAWSELEQFIIHGNISSGETAAPPKATLQGIAHFGIHCPKLKLLRMAIDTRLPDDTPFPDRQAVRMTNGPLAPQLVLHLVDSEPPKVHQLERTAKYLSACFPNTEWIGSNNEGNRQAWRRLCGLIKADRLGVCPNK